jgi:hypothetical protein
MSAVAALLSLPFFLFHCHHGLSTDFEIVGDAQLRVTTVQAQVYSQLSMDRFSKQPLGSQVKLDVGLTIAVSSQFEGVQLINDRHLLENRGRATAETGLRSHRILLV